MIYTLAIIYIYIIDRIESTTLIYYDTIHHHTQACANEKTIELVDDVKSVAGLSAKRTHTHWGPLVSDRAAAR